MADLDNLPRVDPPLRDRAPQEPLTDRGPEWIDAETVEVLGEQLAAGVTSLPPEAGGVVANASQELLGQLFARNLAASPLSATTPMPHRVLALAQAMVELCTMARTGVSGDAPLAPSGVQAARAIGNLELYLAAKRGVLEMVMPDASEEMFTVLLSKVAMIDAPTAANLTGITGAQFAAMRSGGIGPAFIKLPHTRNAIRYPVVALLEWMQEVRG